MPQLVMPNVGEGVTEGTVTRWLKAEGDTVDLDEPIVEVETDKAVVEIPSPFAGTVGRILVQEGETVAIGAPLCEVGAAGDSTQPTADSRPAGAEAPESTQQKADSRPARRAAPAAATGAQPAASANGGRDGRPVSATSSATSSPSLQGGGRGVGRPGNGAEPRRSRGYSPVVLKLAAEHEIDLALVRGTGIEGRVTRQDVLRYIDNPVLHAAPPSSSAGVVGVESQQPPANAASTRKDRSSDLSAAAPDRADRPTGAAAADDLVPLNATRRTIAARMLESHQTVPVAWMAVEADVTGLVALRTREKAAFQQREGVALTYMPFFVKAVVAALKQRPALNATFTDDGVHIHREHHIGIAVAAETGLVVPVVRDAGDKSIAGLAHEIDRLATAAQARKLTIDEMRGATFTLDNTGAFGSIISQPIVPPGQVAIITTEVIRRELRVNDYGAGESFAARSVMNLCISFDHRALDGAEAGRFMAAVKSHLESIREDATVY